MATTTRFDVRNFIDGDERDSAAGETESVINPATGEEIGRAPVSDAQDVDVAVKAAHKAFESWRETTPGDRATALLHIADAIEENGEELSQLESLDVGKPIAAMRDEIGFMADNLRLFAGACRTQRDLTTGEYLQGYTSMIRREPLGVIGQIAPWNYPLMMAVWKIGPALAVGNTVVLKPSEQTPLTALRLAQLASEHLPKGVFNVVFGHGQPAGSSLVEHPLVRMVSITGSVGSGKAVARGAADSLKRVHLELGGKAPVVVFDDADIDAVVEAIGMAGYINAGQDCTAATRVIAGAGVHDEFVAGLTAKANALEMGDPLSDKTELGPLVSSDQRARVQSFFDSAPGNAEAVTGGRAPSGDGFYFEPTVVVGLKQSDDMIQKEIFGPVVTVQQFDSDEQAIEYANGVDYGLAASVWTKDVSRAMNAVRRLEFGTVWVNDHLTIVSEMPHGGFKQSGYGKDMSAYALEDYSELKHVMVKFA